MEFISVCAKDKDPNQPLESNKTFSFGDKFCETSNLVLVQELGVRGTEGTIHNINSVFKINGAPVGVTNNKY